MMTRKPMWSKDEALDLCVEIEEIAPMFGAHVALTGGCLYKDGKRKDIDILFYRIRQQPKIEVERLLGALTLIGFEMGPRLGWVQKAKFGGKHVDLFFPDYNGPEYKPGSGTYS